MKNRSIYPPALAWNFASFGLMIFLCGSGWSVAQATFYQIELAEYKLQVGSALSEVKKDVSDTLEQVSNSPTIAPKERRKIRAAAKKSDRIFDAAEEEIDRSTEKLIHLEAENETNTEVR